MYPWEDCSTLIDSSSSSSSFHCLASSSEWTLITSLITCRAIIETTLLFPNLGSNRRTDTLSLASDFQFGDSQAEFI